MEKSESIKELAGALAKAQGTIRGAIKDSNNPFFKSTYADLASVVEAIREAFSANGIAYTQHIIPIEGNNVAVETILMHASGDWMKCGVLSLPVSKADAQGYGSAITYARRYSLSAAVGIAPEDDDGNAASKSAPKGEAKPWPQRLAAAPPRSPNAASKGVAAAKAAIAPSTSKETAAPKVETPTGSGPVNDSADDAKLTLIEAANVAQLTTAFNSFPNDWKRPGTDLFKLFMKRRAELAPAVARGETYEHDLGSQP